MERILLTNVLSFQSQEDLWITAAQKLTNVIKQIIEFAKLVPGFLKLPQEDQINLLKRGKSTVYYEKFGKICSGSTSNRIYCKRIHSLMFSVFFSAAFEISIIRMSRYYDLSQNAVLFGDIMLPMDAFMTTRNTEEMNLVTQIFEFAKSLAEMQLSEMVLALYSAYVLLQEGKLNKNLLGLISRIKSKFNPIIF